MQKSSKNRIQSRNNHDEIVVSFTKGAKEQLDDLTQYFEKESASEIIKIGISLLQELKDKELARGAKYS